MAFSSGTFSLYATGNPVVTGTTISSSWANNTLNDIATGLSTCVLKDGTQTMTANLPMGAFRITGLGAATALTDASQATQVQNDGFTYLTSVSGTNTIVGTATPTPSAYAAGQRWTFIPAATNTGAATLNVSGKGARNIFSGGLITTGEELVISQPVSVVDDGTQLHIIGQSNSPIAWSPVLTFATAGDLNVVYATQIGYSMKEGRRVTAWGAILTSTFTHTTASGDLKITGFPMTANNTSVAIGLGAVRFAGITKANYTQFDLLMAVNTTYANISACGSAQAAALLQATDTTTTVQVEIRFTVTYFI